MIVSLAREGDVSAESRLKIDPSCSAYAISIMSSSSISSIWKSYTPTSWVFNGYDVSEGRIVDTYGYIRDLNLPDLDIWS